VTIQQSFERICEGVEIVDGPVDVEIYFILRYAGAVPAEALLRQLSTQVNGVCCVNECGPQRIAAQRWPFDDLK
jgi:hypothetical protein